MMRPSASKRHGPPAASYPVLASSSSARGSHNNHILSKQRQPRSSRSSVCMAAIPLALLGLLAMTSSGSDVISSGLRYGSSASVSLSVDKAKAELEEQQIMKRANLHVLSGGNAHKPQQENQIVRKEEVILDPRAELVQKSESKNAEAAKEESDHSAESEGAPIVEEEEQDENDKEVVPPVKEVTADEEPVEEEKEKENTASKSLEAKDTNKIVVDDESKNNSDNNKNDKNSEDGDKANPASKSEEANKEDGSKKSNRDAKSGNNEQTEPENDKKSSAGKGPEGDGKAGEKSDKASEAKDEGEQNSKEGINDAGGADDKSNEQPEANKEDESKEAESKKESAASKNNDNAEPDAEVKPDAENAEKDATSDKGDAKQPSGGDNNNNSNENEKPPSDANKDEEKPSDANSKEKAEGEAGVAKAEDKKPNEEDKGAPADEKSKDANQKESESKPNDSKTPKKDEDGEAKSKNEPTEENVKESEAKVEQKEEKKDEAPEKKEAEEKEETKGDQPDEKAVEEKPEDPPKGEGKPEPKSGKEAVEPKDENKDPEPDADAKAESTEVSCGKHKAPTCEQCVADGQGEGFCNGDCNWCGTSCQKGDCWHPPEPEPWFKNEDKRYDGDTISVVLPCGFEHEYFERTARSVVAATPADVLKEVIVLDDASEPPLEFVNAPEKSRVIRNNGEPLGLIGAKQMGAEATRGDIVVFLDCHVKPALGWWEPIIREIGENSKRVVVPMITHLDVETWIESGRPTGNGGLSKCYLTLDGQFKWTNDDKKWVPIMSGGLLAMARDWFFEIGGHDKSMKGWGGENLDLSLRIWRCGGEIVSASQSFVAHMWRDGNHAAKYTVQPGDVSKNLATAMMGHSNEYFLKKTTAFPGFEKYKESQKSLDLTSIQEPMKQCQSFQWYLDRFSYIYRDAGVIPHEVFQISPDDGKTCLQITPSRPWGNARAPTDTLVLKACNTSREKGSNQWWHASNRKSDGSCCSGLRVWNTDQCLAHATGTSVCSLEGGQGQAAQVTDTGVLVLENDECLSSNDALEASDQCQKGKWKKMNPFAPIEYELLDDEIKKKWETKQER